MIPTPGTRFTDNDRSRNPRALELVTVIQAPTHRVRRPIAVCVSSNGKAVTLDLDRLMNPVRFTMNEGA